MDDIQVGDQYCLIKESTRTFTVKELRPLVRQVILEDSLLRGDGRPYIHTLHLSTLRGMFRVNETNVLPYSYRS